MEEEVWKDVVGYEHAIRTGLKDHLGEKNPNSKLKKEEVEDIKKRIQENQTLTSISKIYNTSITLIWNIKKKTTWK